MSSENYFKKENMDIYLKEWGVRLNALFWESTSLLKYDNYQ